MNSLCPRLQTLINHLDDLGAETTLAGIAGALTNAALTIEDIAPFVLPNPASYARTLVVRRERYELLVLTWLPGQASPPHDHTWSVCALQVIQGTAIESEYSIASDGYADFEYETTVAAGQVSGGQDAGIHTIRNPSTTELLVSVHIYAPPLRDTRRYTPRPIPVARKVEPRTPTVVIVGGGFSGAMTAAHLVSQTANLRVVLVERRGTVGEGLAYSTQDEEHLLNVMAGRMSAWPDKPNDFFEWANNRDPKVQPGDYLPRRWYGEYLRETLHAAAAGSHSRLDIVLEETRRVARHPSGGWMVHLERGTPIRADEVVLAIGHRPPSDPLRKLWTGPRDRFLPDPWQIFNIQAIPPNESVAILGSGLTAVDTVLSLTQVPRSAPITLISRNGLVPQSHASTPLAAKDMGTFLNELLATNSNLKALALGRAIHQLTKKTIAEGGDWRTVIDGIRPHSARLWQALSPTEQLKFISRIRPFWEVHRHRMAPRIAGQITQLQKDGLLKMQQGQIFKVEADQSTVRLDIRQRGADRPITNHFQWVINCTGPTPSNRAEASPVIGSLLVHGWVRRDVLSLGLDVTADGQAVSSDNTVVSDLSVVGTLRKPLLWESTAVPELRNQAAQVAKRIMQRFPADSNI